MVDMNLKKNFENTQFMEGKGKTKCMEEKKWQQNSACVNHEHLQIQISYM